MSCIATSRLFEVTSCIADVAIHHVLLSSVAILDCFVTGTGRC